MVNIRSVKTQFIIFLTALLVILTIKDNNPAYITTSLAALIAALFTDAFIFYLKQKVFRVTESAVITGLIIGYVFSADEPLWRFIAASAIAILFKYLIRVRGRHIFNPAALGIFLSLIFLGVSTQWKGAYLWYLITPFGLYFAHKFRKLEILISYAFFTVVLFGAQALSQKIPVWHIFGYLNYFYIFIMVIEPKTTPLGALGKYIFGATLAILIFILTNMGIKFDVELFSLLALNLSAPLLLML